MCGTASGGSMTSSALQSTVCGRAVAALTAALLVAALLVALPVQAAADTSPPPAVPATVSADALPTVQIDGVAWAQVTVGNTVYVTGSFAFARPAGTPANSAEPGGQGQPARLRHHHRQPDHRLQPHPERPGPGHHRLTGRLPGLRRRRTSPPSTARPTTGSPPSTPPPARWCPASPGRWTTRLGPSPPAIAPSTWAAASPRPTETPGTGWPPIPRPARCQLESRRSQPSPPSAMAPDRRPGHRRRRLHHPGRCRADWHRLGVHRGTGASAPWAERFPDQGLRHRAPTSPASPRTAPMSMAPGTTSPPAATSRADSRPNPTTGQIMWMNTCHGDSYDAVPIGNVLYSASHEHDCSDIGAFSQDDAAAHCVDAPLPRRRNHGQRRHVAQAGLSPAATGYPDRPTPTSPASRSSTQLMWYPTLTARQLHRAEPGRLVGRR